MDSTVRKIAIVLVLSSSAACAGDSPQRVQAGHRMRDAGRAREGVGHSQDGDAGSRTAPGDAGSGTVQPCPVAPRLSHGPLLGNVSASAVTVWIRADRDARFEVAYWPTKKSGAKQTSKSVAARSQEDFTAVVALSGLQPNSSYEYRVKLFDAHATDCTADESAVRAFRTLPAPGPARLRFVTAGDVNGANVPGFDDIAAVDPDFVLMLGDNVYADGFGDTFDAYQARYQTVWSGKQFQALFSTVPAFRIWDDHEIVDNYWDGKNDDIYVFARRLYEDYQNSMNPPPLVKGELYYSFAVGEIAFFVLDERSHRSRNGDPDGPKKSMLGAAQKQALKHWLNRDPSLIHVIVSSVLVSRFGTTGKDSWSSFATERDEILQAIHDFDPSNVMVISGDQHWSAILRNDAGASSPYPVYEFETTPLAFSENKAPIDVDDSVLALDNTHRVFGVFDVDTTTNPASVDFTACAVDSPCTPSEEAPPMTMGGATVLPYTVRFVSSEHGLHLRD